MKVFVAAGPGAKKRSDDFSWTVDGELVRLPFDRCDCPDCGCDRAMAGLASSKATTTFAVIDNPGLDTRSYVGVFRDAIRRQGFLGDDDDDGWVAELAGEQLRLAAGFTPGQVLEIRDGRIRAR
ncbi:MAG: hypothetical protein WBV06_05240 [Acidimicrobiia bacterium]|jgi:hypothetical protein